MNLRTLGQIYGLLWAFTLTAALVVALTPLAASVRESLQLTFTAADPGAAGFVHIWLRNSMTCLVPLWLLLLVDPARGGFRALLPSLLLLIVFVPSIVLVGSALGAYRLELLAYLVHLPLEWAAVAYSLSLWCHALRAPFTRPQLLKHGATLLVLTLAAALVEVAVSA